MESLAVFALAVVVGYFVARGHRLTRVALKAVQADPEYNRRVHGHGRTGERVIWKGVERGLPDQEGEFMAGPYGMDRGETLFLILPLPVPEGKGNGLGTVKPGFIYDPTGTKPCSFRFPAEGAEV